MAVLDVDSLHLRELQLLYEKRHPAACDHDLVAFNDPHDLIAVVSLDAQEVVVYRLNGQVAFKIAPSKTGDEKVTSLAWKADGSVLGVTSSNGLCGIYSGENGKLLSAHSTVDTRRDEASWKLDLKPEVDVDELELGGRPFTSCIGWTAHIQPSARQKTQTQEPTTEDWFIHETDSVTDITASEAKPGVKGLADTIAKLDVTDVLPRLSAIPTHGVRLESVATKFTTQAGVDDILGLKDRSSSEIDFLITSASSGSTSFYLDDSVKLGSCNLSNASLRLASHPQCSAQVVLTKSGDDEPRRSCQLHYFEMPLDFLGGSMLHVVALNTKRIQNLVSYVLQTVRCVEHDFNTGIQLQSRLIGNLEAELKEKGEYDASESSLYHLALTGHFEPIMLEWLTDVVKETNHKRWDNALTAMYTDIQNHIFINLVPALDRLTIATTALRGHARFNEGSSSFVHPDVFTALLKDVDSVRLVAQKIQLMVMTAYRQFRAFSRWLLVMIDIGTAGPGSKSAIEIEEREAPSLDYSLTIAYIEKTMKHSQLDQYIKQPPTLQGSRSKEDFFAEPLIAGSTYAHVRDLVYKEEKPVPLPIVTVRMAANARLAVEAITAWQSKMLPKPKVIPLAHQGPIWQSEVTIHDLRLLPTEFRGIKGSRADLLTSNPGEIGDELTIARTTQTPTALSRDYSNLRLRACKVKDATFVSDGSCIALLAHDNRLVLLRWDSSASESGRSDSSTLLRIFPKEADFQPDRVVVGGRPGKRVCVVFADRHRKWKVFDLDGGVNASAAMGNGGMDVDGV